MRSWRTHLVSVLTLQGSQPCARTWWMWHILERPASSEVIAGSQAGCLEWHQVFRQQQCCPLVNPWERGRCWTWQSSPHLPGLGEKKQYELIICHSLARKNHSCHKMYFLWLHAAFQVLLNRTVWSCWVQLVWFWHWWPLTNTSPLGSGLAVPAFPQPKEESLNT